MGKLYLASRSTLGTTVLVMPEIGPAILVQHYLPHLAIPGASLEWGVDSAGCWLLASALWHTLTGRHPDQQTTEESTLTYHLARCTQDVWVMSEADLLEKLVRPY